MKNKNKNKTIAFTMGLAAAILLAPSALLSRKSALDIAFDTDGTLYVLEIAHDGIPDFGSGRLYRVAPGGSPVQVDTGPLFAPGGVAIGRDGAVYITNRSITPAGEVLRVVQ